MTVINDNAGIFSGQKTVLSPEQKRNMNTLLWLINKYTEQVYQALLKYGYTGGKDVPSIIRGTVKQLRADNTAFRQDLVSIARPNSRKSNLEDPEEGENGTNAGWLAFLSGGGFGAALGALTNLFKGSPKSDNDISDELIQLQIEKQKQQQMKNLLIFGGIAVVGILSIVIIVKATQ